MESTPPNIRWHDILEQITLVTDMVRFTCCSLVDKNLQYSVISCGGWWRIERRMRNRTYHAGKGVHRISFTKPLPFFVWYSTWLVTGWPGLSMFILMVRALLSPEHPAILLLAEILCFSERFGLPQPTQLLLILLKVEKQLLVCPSSERERNQSNLMDCKTASF